LILSPSISSKKSRKLCSNSSQNDSIISDIKEIQKNKNNKIVIDTDLRDKKSKSDLFSSPIFGSPANLDIPLIDIANKKHK